MIISHKHRFIFIKTRKTAGTSIEIALSKFCGPDDVITPITDEDEELRRSLGYPGPQNCDIPLARFRTTDWWNTLRRGKRVRFYNHAPARFVRDHIDRGVWNAYFKFAFERNPFDRAISIYYWGGQNKTQAPISDWIRDGGLKSLRIPGIYVIDEKIAVDEVFRYEELDAAMRAVAARLSLPEVPELPFTKHQARTDRRPYREVLSEADLQAIVDHCGERYLEELGYSA